MSLSVPNTGATAVEASKYAVITQDRLETSWNCPPIVGSRLRAWVHPAYDNCSGVLVLGLRSLLETSPLWQQRRPLHDVVFEIRVGNLVLAPLHPPAYRDARLMYRVRIAGYQRMPP